MKTEQKELVEWCWWGKTQILGEKSVSLPLWPQHVPHWLPWNWNNRKILRPYSVKVVSAYFPIVSIWICSIPGKGKGLLFLKLWRLALGSTQHPVWWVVGALSSGMKCPEHEDIYFPSCAQVKNALNYTFTSSYAYMVWTLISTGTSLPFVSMWMQTFPFVEQRINAPILMCTKAVSSQLIFKVFMVKMFSHNRPVQAQRVLGS